MKRFACLLLLASTLSGALHAGVDEEWAALIALDAGPKKKPASREEAQSLARNHLLIQRRTVEQFLAKYPSDPRAFDARLRLAAILAAEGKMDGNPKQVNQALSLLVELENKPDAPWEKRADAGFQRASLTMQNQDVSLDRMRETIVTTAKNFTAKYPGDRRGPRLLVEAATICDDVPNQKRELLEQSLSLTREEPLKRRISDDLKRLDLLGKPLELQLTATSGVPIDLAALRGNVVVLIFWAADSPHCLLWLREFRSAWEQLPKAQLRVVTISLDTDRKALEEKLAALQADWPTHFDGKGWESPVARSLGINALPTVWILDKKGVLRTLNARSSYETWIRKLLRE